MDGQLPQGKKKDAAKPDEASAADRTEAAVSSAGTPAAAELTFDFLAPPQAADEMGRLGPYRVLKVLGHGGMGVVFQAEDVRLGRMVALKAMLPEFAKKAQAKERFLREARAAAALEHDHIVAIYQVDEERGVPYIAMPFLKGLSLDDYLKKHAPGAPLKPAQTLKIGREIAKGLAAAHERGLIHRDIKPANVWLDASAGGRVKILDFGLARLTQQGDEKNLTQSGTILGTPSYMSPEQAQGAKVDARTDLFSLGVVLYRLCTGEMPFRGPDIISTLMAVAMTKPPAPKISNDRIPQELSDLVMRLLAKTADERPASAGDVAKAIHAIEKKLTSMGKPPVADATVDVPAPTPGPAPAEKTVHLPTDPHPGAAPRRAPSRRWIIVALAAVLLLVPLGWWLGTVVFRGETDPNVVEQKKGPASLDPDRKAAEYVLSIGGTLRVNDEEREISVADNLPRQPFRLRLVRLRDNKQVDDAGLASFQGCTNVWHFDLHGTKISDVGLVHFAGCKSLTELSLFGTKISNAGLANFTLCKDLAHVFLGNTVVTNEGLAHFENCKSLTVLTLDGAQISDAALANLMNFKNLTSLWLHKTKITATGIDDLKKALPRCKIEWDGGVIEPKAANLDPDRKAAEYVLSIGGIIKIKEKGAEQMTKVVGDLPHGLFVLGAVSLAGEEKVDDAGLAHFKDCKNVTWLNLANTKVSDAGLAHFKDCKNFIQLILGYTKVSDVGLAHFADCRDIINLDLAGTKVGNAGLAYFKDCQDLMILQLAFTKVNDAGLANFKGCKKVTQLNLEYTEVKDEGLAHFKDCKNLTQLRLTATGVSDAGLAHMRNWKQLAYVNLKKTKVTAAGIDDLKKALPKCKIEWDGGVIEPAEK